MSQEAGVLRTSWNGANKRVQRILSESFAANDEWLDRAQRFLNLKDREDAADRTRTEESNPPSYGDGKAESSARAVTHVGADASATIEIAKTVVHGSEHVVDERAPSSNTATTAVSAETGVELVGSSKHALLSTRRPKDVMAGVSSGLKSIVRGTLVGMAHLVVFPWHGAATHGLSGFATGLAAGAYSAVALPTAGVAVAAYQIGRGIANRRESKRCAQQGMVWNDETREWYFYSLDAERAETAEKQRLIDKEQRQCGEESNPRPVQDTTYYDLLQVSSSASPSRLKKAYYQQALKVHPDHNDDPEAAEHFQSLSHAYQVLASAETRERYDKYGPKAFQSERDDDEDVEVDVWNEIDPKIFFSVLFGTQALRPYIGQLWISGLFGAKGACESSSFSLEEQEALLQTQRQLEIAFHLRRRISDFVNEKQTREVFINSLQQEAAELLGSNIGNTVGPSSFLLVVIGTTLEKEATKFLIRFGNGRPHKQTKMLPATDDDPLFADSTGESHSDGLFRRFWSGKKDGPQLLQHLKTFSMSSWRSRWQMLLRQATGSTEESLMYQLASVLNRFDIALTLRKACQRLLADNSVETSLQLRIRRAQALHALGHELRSAAQEHEKQQVTKLLEERRKHGVNRGRWGVKKKRRRRVNDASIDLESRVQLAAMTAFAQARGLEVSQDELLQVLQSEHAQPS